MTLHPPFQISPRLLPGLPFRDGAWISLDGIGLSQGKEGCDTATFIFDLPDGTVFEDDRLQSGMQGFSGSVGVFESLLGFLGACAESYGYEQRTGSKGECSDLFPPHVAQWAYENQDDIDSYRSDICVDPGSDMPNESLIEE